MNIEKDLVETDDPEIEMAPDATGLVEVPSKQGIEDIVYLGDNINRVIDAQNKIRLAVLKLAQPGDWVTFGDNDSKKAELGFAGALRIASTLGVSFSNWASIKETGTDDLGSWYRWEFECDAIFRGRTVRVYGRAGSRDKFFGKVRGEFKPLHEVDEGNIKMAARRGAMKEGTKVMFGLHHMDPKYLETNGIKLIHAGGYVFKTQEQKVEENSTVTVGLSDAKIFKIGKHDNGTPWQLYQIKTEEGDTMFTYSDTIFTQAKQAVFDKKQVTISWKTSKKGGKEIVTMVVS